jgi:hypothetical protein
MKAMYNWYFPPSEEEIKKIWAEGILTVDTNVLLDLYRYHTNTRKALLSSLNKFKNRAWLSHQVSEEFFRNRSRVILSASGSFTNAEKVIVELRKSIDDPLNKLKGNRIISDDVEAKLRLTINTAIDDAEKVIAQSKNSYPDYRKADPILDIICKAFDSRVGEPFSAEQHADALKEGKKRKDNRIPPGFLDSGKDGDRPYGDYFIWRQVMDYIKAVQKPLILVTSEQKEDWWEKASGQIIGPLYELQKEFFQETGQRFLFYRTDRFLEFSNENSGQKANSDAVNEIRDFVNQRQRESPLVKVIEQKVLIEQQDMTSGTLTVELLESAYKFNCTGHFVPGLSAVPELTVKMLKCPDASINTHLGSGTGTSFDFHIYLKSVEFGALLPTGIYIFEYKASF